MATGESSNKYCRSTDLSNEASVESFFVMRMLTDLGYDDKEIKPKRSIDEVQIARGRRREPFKPDYLINARKKPRWLIDAKATNEKIDDYTYQCAGYALGINRRFKDSPLRFFMLTNGLLTHVYAWDQEDRVLSLQFADFVDGNARYEALRKLLGADVVRDGWATPPPLSSSRVLRRPALDEVKRAFIRCHRIIWKAEKMSPQAAFDAFAKLLFVKLWEDRKLRDDAETLALIGRGEPIDANRVRFSVSWIEAQEANDPNPVGDILFRQLVDFLEEEIAKRKRKRIFEPSERLGLGPGTIKRVVAELENLYLFGIDEDLNGRMFEAFLTATMRGQDLGQYFTPRSIVKLMSTLAEPVASPQIVERVLDGCCGTGGFLIEALTDMRAQIYANASLSKRDRQKLLEEVANEAIFGIDAGTNPPIARIARINMYLHGDGGSRIYTTDGLRLSPRASGAETLEVRQEVEELRRLLEDGPIFDVVLTNPPFSMDYSASVPDEAEVLDGYDLVSFGGKKRPALRSTVMFLERYWRLLKPGGRILTVIDDSILSGPKYGYVRDFIRERFVIRAVISLHGDAFQRSGARAKTSVLYLTKRTDESESQPAAFVHESRYIGLDDVVPSTRQSVAEMARTSAESERDEIVAAFKDYQLGKPGPWLVAADRLSDRLDAKFLKPWTVRDLETTWTEAGATSARLGDLVDLVGDSITLDGDTEYQFLRISYLGHAEGGERSLGKEVSYTRIGRATPGDIVVSNISAVYGSICVLPEGFEHLLTSNEFTILRLKPGADADPFYLWSVLRTSGVIAEWLSSTTGVGRHRVNWESLKDQRVPLLPSDQQRAIGDLYREAWKRSAEAERLQAEALALIAALELEGDAARDRRERAKPPR